METKKMKLGAALAAVIKMLGKRDWHYIGANRILFLGKTRFYFTHQRIDGSTEMKVLNRNDIYSLAKLA